MKLYSAAYAPNPRRVRMFIAEKGLTQIEEVTLNLLAGEHKTPEFRSKSVLAQVPVLELDDGRCLTESRAICQYLETVYPEPNLMGAGDFERAEIEMWDRRVEWGVSVPLMLWVRFSHPALAALEPDQDPVIAAHHQARAMRGVKWLDGVLAHRPWIAGERFTIADITAACGIDFAKMLKWRIDEGLPHLQRWRDAIEQRASGQISA